MRRGRGKTGQTQPHGACSHMVEKSTKQAIHKQYDLWQKSKSKNFPGCPGTKNPPFSAGAWHGMLVAQWCLTLCNPMVCSPLGSSVHGILEWVAIAFSRDLPNPGIKPGSPALQADSATREAPSNVGDLGSIPGTELSPHVALEKPESCNC